MKKVGLVGYFGWGNYGDELFVDVLSSLFEDQEECTTDVVHDLIKDPYFSGPVQQRVDEFDAIVIGGGDLVIPWVISPLYWKKEYLTKPVYIVGVEVPTWGGYSEAVCLEMREFFQHDNVRFVHARSEASAAWIQKHLQPRIRVESGVDIVCAKNFDTHWSPNKVLGLITRAHQNIDPVNINALMATAVAAGWSIKHIPLATGATAKDDIEEAAAASYFTPRSITRAETIEALTHEIQTCHLVVSMKFHGCVAAHMSGVPTITLSRANKFTNFAEQTGRTEFLSLAQDQNLPSLFEAAQTPVDMEEVKDLKERSRGELEALRDLILADLAV